MLHALREQGTRRGAAVSRRFVAPLACGLVAGSCSSGTAPDRRPVDMVAVVPANATVAVGGSFRLDAEARDAGGTLLTGRSAHWSVEDEAIASVAPDGRVTAVAVGVVQIAASIEGISGVSVVTVTRTPVASVHLSASNLTLNVGDSTRLSAQARDASGAVLTGRPIAWTTSNPVVATVSSSGMVTALAPGAAIIRAEAESRAAMASVNVASAATPATLTVTPSTATLERRQQLTLTAVIRNTAGTVVSGLGITWSSSNTRVASVNGSGRVTARERGTTVITATAGGVTGSSTITVVNDSDDDEEDDDDRGKHDDDDPAAPAPLPPP